MITRRVTIKYRSELERPVSWVALVGFMGAGKSRIGAELSRKLHLNFIDTDRVIERVSCLTIPEIFELYGEATLRDYESEIVRRSCRLDDAIVSTGGGVVVRPKNREALKHRGPVVLLTASAETTFQRTRRHKRPLLEVGNPIERINDLMAARKGFYEDVASFAVSTDGRPSTEVVDEIIEKLYQWQQEQAQLRMLQEAGYCVQASATHSNIQPQPSMQNGSPHGLTQANVVYVKTQRLETQRSEAQHLPPEPSDTTQHSGIQHSEAQYLNALHVETQQSNDEHFEDQHLDGQHLEGQHLEQQHTNPQQILPEENTLNNNQQSDGAFTDNYLTESMQPEASFDNTDQPDLLDAEFKADTVQQTESQSQSEHSTKDTSKNTVEEKPGRDIYMEMIRDLMRDPRA